MPATQQHALTVVANLRSGLGPVEAVSASMKALRDDVNHALARVSTLHFGRFVLLPDEPGAPPTRLAFESNHDGPEDAHVRELAAALAPFEDRLFVWEGYTKGDFPGFVRKHALPASTFYLGHPGLSRDRILADDEVRDRLAALLDQMDAAGELEGRSAWQIREALLAKLPSDGKERVLGYIDRGLPVQPFEERKFYLIAAGVVATGVLGFLAPILITEARDRARESQPGNAPRLITEGDPRLDPIIDHEDRVTQNGLTHYVPLRPGKLRKLSMSVILWTIEQARKKIAYHGTLGGITSIHFARWVMLPDDRVLFFSNYDGSWEAYLGDFVDKAHIYLSAVWSNTRWFPKTHALVLKGAAQESTFKQWTRTFQVENQIWYSAYPHLTVENVLDNAKIREGAVGTMTEEEARAWLALF
ncbi:MAG: hypothetical protein JST00_40670 [Deltaproteobacteria bacterium]|nr:hypothetical protein [Deltaproteobacteria bacterium]